MTPNIRYFAHTDSSPLGLAALEYGKALMQLGRVRLASMSGVLSGPWLAYMALTATPMTLDWVSVVCCDPARWVWIQRVPMPKRDIGNPTDGSDVEVEISTGRIELYTAGKQNVLIATEAARSAEQLVTAKKYERLVVQSHTHSAWWLQHGGCQPYVVPTPVPMAAFREAVGI